MNRPKEAPRTAVWLELLGLELREEDIELTVRSSDGRTEPLYINLLPGRRYLLKQIDVDPVDKPEDFVLTMHDAAGHTTHFYLLCDDAEETANRISDHARAVKARRSATPVPAEVLMSQARSLPALERLEFGEDSLTFEMHHPSYGVAVVTVGFRDRRHLYTLVETGERLGTEEFEVLFTPAVMFGAEDENGNVYRWYLRTPDPAATAIRVREHLEAHGGRRR